MDVVINLFYSGEKGFNKFLMAIGTASANSEESDHRCTARIFFDNKGDNVTLTLYNVTLT